MSAGGFYGKTCFCLTLAEALSYNFSYTSDLSARIRRVGGKAEAKKGSSRAADPLQRAGVKVQVRQRAAANSPPPYGGSRLLGGT